MAQRKSTLSMIRQDAKAIRQRDGLRKGWSIGDCIALAADGLRDEAHERRMETADLRQISHDFDLMAAA